jgi:hypothetical protein
MKNEVRNTKEMRAPSLFALRSSYFALSIAAFCLATASIAGAILELAPRPVTFNARELPLDAVLKALEKQTGNPIEDRRSNRDHPIVKLPAGPATFWQTLDTMGLGFSTYQPDGGVALVDAPYRKLPTHYSGLFRFTFKRIAVSRDEATQAHYCHVTLDAAWEPRFQPLYLNLEHAEVRFGKQSEKLERQTSRSVSGSCATEIDLRMKAPSRATLKLDALKGELRVIGASKMLDFTFAKAAKGSNAEQEGVKVSVTALTRTKDRWIIDLAITNPHDAREHLSSYQSWLDNNRIWLTWGMNRLEVEPSQVDDASKPARCRYEFVSRGKTPLPLLNENVTLHYRTPSRVVAFAVPFEFRDLPLP